MYMQVAMGGKPKAASPVQMQPSSPVQTQPLLDTNPDAVIQVSSDFENEEAPKEPLDEQQNLHVPTLNLNATRKQKSPRVVVQVSFAVPRLCGNVC